jgi:type VI secretion system protein VasG
MNVNLKGLIAKLDDTCRRALESAAGLCLTRTHYDVDIEHLFMKLLDTPDTDLQKILRHYGVDKSRLERDLTRVLDRLKTGNARNPTIAPRVPKLINEAWSIGSIDFGANKVRSGHLLLALISQDDLARMARESSPELQKISPEDLHKNLGNVIAGSAEDYEQGVSTTGAQMGEPGRPVSSKTPALDQYTVDLTAQAKQGKIDPVLGRDAEIRQVIDILTRRRQNNPILTGEAGVGKTAVVEGLALRIAEGDVPPPLKNVTLRVLDLALLQAGAGVKGEFENRLKSVINEVKASPTPIITFIDEAHTLIGAGGAAGQGDAANLLKPALARGELRTIAATTWAEYKKYFEKDPALTRRFQVVKVEEPTETSAINMMRGLAGTMEEHHKVRILDEAVEAAVKLSHRYISGRQLPDKSVSVLDTACARVALGQVANPPALEDCERHMAIIGREIEILEREAVTGGDHRERLDELVKEKAVEEKRHADLKKQWEHEKHLVGQISTIRQRLEGTAGKKSAKDGKDATAPLSPEEKDQLREDLIRLNKELVDLQGENPLLQPCVDAQAIAQVISAWTGIPVGRMVKDEINTVMNLKEHLEKRVIGQSHALEAISQRLKTARARLADPRRPIGVFMLVGPSGVGKTETALALAELLFGSDQNITVINMSEYKEEHKVSLLMGSPPGYVGYGEGGVLTEAVRRKPYSVVLLDEMEKAHVGVQDIFYQVFDKGMMKDGEGRDIDFKNTVIIMTSNAGTDTFMKLCADPETRPDAEGLAEAIRPDLLKYFKPAFMGRVIVVPYFPIAPDIMRKIIELQLGRIRGRIRENHKAQLTYDEALVNTIASRCTDVDSGARNVDHIVTRTLLPELSQEFLSRMAAGEQIAKVHISVGPEGGFQYTLS